MSAKDPLSETLTQLESNLAKSNDISMSVVTTLDNFVTRFSKLTNEMESMNKHIQDFKTRHRNIDLTIRRLQDISENFNKPYEMEKRLKTSPEQVSSDLDGFLEVVDEVKNSKKFFQQNHYYKSYDKAIKKLRMLDEHIITRFHNELLSLLENSCPSFTSGENFLKFLFLEDPKYKEYFLNSLKTKNLVFIDDYLDELGNVDSRFHKILTKVDDCKVVRSASSFEGGKDEPSLLLPFLCLLIDKFPKEEKLFFINMKELEKITRICGALSKMKNDEYVQMYITNRPKSIRRMLLEVYPIEKLRKRNRRRRAMSMSSRINPQGQLRLRSSTISQLTNTENKKPPIILPPKISRKERKKRKKRRRNRDYSSDDDDDDDDEEEEEEEEEESGEEDPMTPIAINTPGDERDGTSELFERHFYMQGSHPYLYLLRFYLRLLNEEKWVCSTLVNQSDAKAHPTAIFGQVILSSLKAISESGMRIAKKGKESDTGIISQHSEQFFVFLDLLQSYDLQLRDDFEKILKDSTLGTLSQSSSMTKSGGKTKGSKFGMDRGKDNTSEKRNSSSSSSSSSSKKRLTYFSLVDSVFSTFRTRVVQRFNEFQPKELIGQTKMRKNEALLTTIHPSIPIAFTFFKRLLNYREIVETLLRDHYPFSRKITSVGRPGRDCRAIGEYIRIVIEDTISGTILGPIASKSKGKNEMLSSLFELNNYYHILNKLEKGQVRSIVDASVLKRYQSSVRKAETRFVEVTWGKLCDILEKILRERPDTKMKKSRKVIKGKYKDWQKGWMKLTLKTKLPVLNKKLRERVIEATKEKVVLVFKDFLDEYETLLMTDRGLLKYNVKTVRDTIENMYDE